MRMAIEQVQAEGTFHQQIPPPLLPGDLEGREVQTFSECCSFVLELAAKVIGLIIRGIIFIVSGLFEGGVYLWHLIFSEEHQDHSFSSVSSQSVQTLSSIRPPPKKNHTPPRSAPSQTHASPRNSEGDDDSEQPIDLYLPPIDNSSA